VRLSLPSGVNPILDVSSNSSRVATAAIQSLEDIGSETAQSMGLVAEQESYLLDASRSVIMSEKD
jgi:hypothetical protein